MYGKYQAWNWGYYIILLNIGQEIDIIFPTSQRKNGSSGGHLVKPNRHGLLHCVHEGEAVLAWFSSRLIHIFLNISSLSSKKTAFLILIYKCQKGF